MSRGKQKKIKKQENFNPGSFKIRFCLAIYDKISILLSMGSPARTYAGPDSRTKYRETKQVLEKVPIYHHCIYPTEKRFSLLN
jgi:hypothetical protein